MDAADTSQPSLVVRKEGNYPRGISSELLGQRLTEGSYLPSKQEEYGNRCRQRDLGPYLSFTCR